MGIVKEVKRTANVAWSPREMQSILLAGGTVAQQLDATFSTSAHIEIFSVDLSTQGRELRCVGKIHTKSRFHKLNWSGLGLSDGSHSHGVLVGGSDNGVISFWDVAKILQSDSENALMCQTEQHIGAVRTLDINPFQSNLLASGASESEIYIWDLNNPTSPMSPGNKLHPLEDVTCVAWNRQAQHILGSTSPSGRSVVWDLRKNEPIIQVSDTNSRVHCKAITWHPDIPTQLVTGSEDDRSPVIQLWDLRFATSPTRTLERHKRGVLSLSWCQQDSDLLLSAAKDNQVLCWNPNSNVQDGEVVYQLPVMNQWIFECSWCPRNPDIICTASFDGHVSLYSLLGGGSASVSEPGTPTNIDPNDPFASIAQAQKKVTKIEETPLKTPPKWFRRPCAASFGFGGHLVSFGSKSRLVNISQVVTEPHLLSKSTDFEAAVKNKHFTEHCDRKMESLTTEREQRIWNFLKATFDNDPRRQYLQLLGYDEQELEKQFSMLPESSNTKDLSVDKLQEKLATLPLEQDEEGVEEEEAEEEEGEGYENDEQINNDGTSAGLFASDGYVLVGDGGNGSVFDEISEMSAATDHSSVSGKTVTLATGDDTDGMLTKALLVGNFKAAVDICFNTGRMAEALILAVAGGSDLYEATQQRFCKQSDHQITKLISLVTNRDWSELVKNGSLDNWQEILASLVTYATPEEFTTLCNDLGKRLEDAGFHDEAVLCYICSGNVEKFVDCWLTSMDSQCLNPLILHDLIEKVVLLRHAICRRTRKDPVPFTNSLLADRIRSYADMLAAQGSLKTALSYLELTSSSTQVDSAILCDRLYHSIGSAAGNNPPPFPFERVNIGTHAPASTYAPTGTTSVQQPGAIGGLPAQSVTEQLTNPYQSPNNYARGYGGGQGAGRVGGTGGGVSNPYGGVSRMTGRVGVGDGSYMSSSSGGGGNVTQPISHTMYSKPNVHSTPHSTPSIMNPYGPMVPTTSSSVPPPGPMMYPSTTSASSNYSPVYTPPMGTETSFGPPPPTTTAPSAWNDPPMLNKAKKTKAYNPPAPLTSPLAPSTEPVQPVGPPVGSHVKPGTPVEARPPASPVTPVEKKPIPQEHSAIPMVLEGLLTQCRTRANNAAMRRKADDIGRKLEVLSDLLRDSRLSVEILQGLHYIVQDCQAMNYHSALARLNQMVASSNISEISSFFPGVKTLLQLAIQLRI